MFTFFWLVSMIVSVLLFRKAISDDLNENKGYILKGESLAKGFMVVGSLIPIVNLIASSLLVAYVRMDINGMDFSDLIDAIFFVKEKEDK